MQTRYLLFIIMAFIMACSTSKDVAKTDIKAKTPIEPIIPVVDSSRLLTLDRVFSGEFRMRFFGGIKWREDGKHFTRVERDANGIAIYQYDASTGSKSVLINTDQLTPEGTDQPLIPSDYVWSADKNKLLVFTNTQRVWRTNTRGDYWVLDKQSEQLTKVGTRFPESSLMFAKFSPDANKVAYVSGHNLYVEDLRSGDIAALTSDGSEDIINGTFDWAYEEELFCKDGFRWSPDGNRIAFWRVDASEIGDYLMINNTDSIYPFVIPVEYPKAGQDPSAAKIGVITLNNGQLRWLDIPGDPKQHYLPRMQWVDTDQVLVQQLNRKQNTLILWLGNARSGRAKKLYTEKETAWVDIVHMDVNSPWEMLDLPQIGSEVVRLTDKDGWRHIYAIPLDGKSVRQITQGDYDIARNYVLGLDDGTGYICASPENATQRYLFNIDMDGNDSPKRVTPVTYSGINQYDVSPSGKFAIHQHSSATKPRSYHLISLPDHKIIKTFVDNDSYSEKLRSIDLPQVEFFQVTTEDGITMDGRMFKPNDFDPSKKYPVIFYVYGEPAGQTATDNWSPSLWSVLLTHMGYLYITMDNRGQPTLKGRDWRKSIYRKVGVVNSRDQAMAAKEVLKWPFTDPDRVAVWGWSGGGAMTLNLMFRYPEIYQTGVAVAAVTNHLYYDNIYQERYMGLPSENMEDYIEGSPISHVQNLKGNLLYIHGTGDDNVQYQNAEALINALVSHNKQFDMMAYPNRSHGIYEGQNTTRHLYSLMTNYFMEHCPPGGF